MKFNRKNSPLRQVSSKVNAANKANKALKIISPAKK